MSERAKVIVKTPEAKRGNSFSKTRKSDFSQSISSPIDQILFLQKTSGNQSVQRLFKSGYIQAKLKIGQPNDIYEQEADKVADQIMKIPHPAVQPKPLPFKITPMARRQPVKEEREFALDIEARINALRGGGQPLDPATRAYFEPRFGYDFSKVRIQADSQAAEAANVANARAFTVGRNIVFGTGEHIPRTAEGQRLLAHELTHVVQQHGFIPQTIRLSPRRETEPPSEWCDPYSSREEAKKEWVHIFLKVVGTLKPWLGDEVAALWADYLKRKPGDSLSPWIYSNPSSRLVRGFAESSTTEEHHRWLLDLAKIKLPALYKTTPTLNQPNQWNFVPVEKLFTESILNYEINWSRSPFDIPAMTAGGVSESDAGKDSRRLSGTMGLFRKTDEGGRTVGLTLMTNFRFHVKDCIDFCPGGTGSLAEQEYTVSMSRLEASGLAYDRPFEVYFVLEPLVEELDVSFIERCIETNKPTEVRERAGIPGLQTGLSIRKS